MHQLHKNDRRQSMRTFLPSLKMLFLAMPIWIFLFLAFPRFSASLMHVKPPQGGTGFSAKLSPGSVGQLVQTDETAFRVKFNHALRSDDMYFRGAILSEGNGLNWKKSTQDEAPSRADAPVRHPTNLRFTEQDFVIEPTFQKAVFALDYPATVTNPESNGVIQKQGQIFEFKDLLQNRILYHVESSNTNLEILNEYSRANYLQVPRVSQKVLDLANELSKNAKTPEKKISNLLSYFATRKFGYSLEPGQMPGDGLTTFLFEKRVGFCEHYAAAVSTLARLMNVPARVVVGFQGGKYNELTDYYVVKTLDAHAWSEFWSDETKKWTRVDATQVVAPFRISFGAEAYKQGLNQASLIEAQNSVSARISTSLFFAIDAVTTKWNNFLLKYDFDYQNKLLEGFGFAKSSRMTLFIFLFAGLAALTAALKIYFGSQKSKADPILSLYHQFCRKLEIAGVVRDRTEGPEHFKNRAVETLPQKKQLLEDIFRTFIEIRYLGQKEPVKLKFLRNSVKSFSTRP